MSEPTYTLADARREIAKQECANFGHRWDIVANFGGRPVRIICESCGWSGDVTMGDVR